MANGDLSILEAALAGEYFGVSAYDAALGLNVLSAGAAQVARNFQSDHRDHATRISDEICALGGQPPATKSWAEYAELYPPPALETEADVLRYAASLERSAAAADANALAELESPELRVLFARIGAVEAMHWAVLLQALGENPVPSSLLPADQA